MDQSTRQSVLLPDVFQKPVRACFDAPTQTSDAGLLLLGAIDRRLGLTSALCAHFSDRRQTGKVDHPLGDLFRQRVYSMAAGYADGNDAQFLRHDPVLKMLCDRDPEYGEPLASQPTLSRFENAVRGRDLIRAGRDQEKQAIARFAAQYPEAQRVVIDLDATEDPTHGQQMFSFFNAFYDAHCFLPLLAFLSVHGHLEQHFLAARLRPGIGASNRGVIPLLRRTVAGLRAALPGARILVRLDGGFPTPLLLNALEELRVEYVIGLPANTVLIRKSKGFLRGLRKAVRATGRAARRYGSFVYGAKTWKKERRIVVKAEVLPPPPTAPKRRLKPNLRYVVTNLRTTPRHVYEDLYCPRGDSENRIKELKADLEMDRTSCSSFVANQLRVLMSTTAYVLFQEMRRELAASDLARAQVHTLRLRLVKIGAVVKRSVRRIVLHLPRACPSASTWCALARRLALAPG
jgi:hypothetical protein